MRLTLVDNLVMPEEGDLALLDVHPHLGLLALAASAARDGVKTSIYDPKRLLRNGTLRYDEGLEAILGVFAEPQRCDAVAAMLREATGDDGVDDAFFRELVGAGILVPAPETTAGAMH